MELQITGQSTELLPEVRRYAERKLGKLGRHLPNIIETKLEISEEQTKFHKQHYVVRVTGDSKAILHHGEERGQDLFARIDK